MSRVGERGPALNPKKRTGPTRPEERATERLVLTARSLGLLSRARHVVKGVEPLKADQTYQSILLPPCPT